MLKRVIGSMAIGLLLSVTGCVSSNIQPMEMQCHCPAVPGHLTSELPAPPLILQGNKGLLFLLAEYEALRRRFNADRAAVVDIMTNDVGED